jgi:hypothetical protein
MFNIKDIFRKNNFVKDELKVYKPKRKVKPPHLIKVTTAWVGLEQIIEDILNRFDIGRENCIEFGVEFGYSSVVFSNYFKQVTGVDTFEGDVHTSNKSEHFEATTQRLSPFPNIKLIKANYKDWIVQDEMMYNFAHVDIVHNYQETFECGLWSAQHSQCTIFHDTESFPEVRRAVKDIAKATGKEVYNYPYNHGLGIIVGPNK